MTTMSRPGTNIEKNRKPSLSGEATLALSIVAASFSLFIACEEAGGQPQKGAGLSALFLRADKQVTNTTGPSLRSDDGTAEQQSRIARREEA